MARITTITQAAVGEVGRKATTDISFDFDSLISVGPLQYGANEKGIFLLNRGVDDAGEPFTRSFTLPTMDFAEHRQKRIDALFIRFWGTGGFVASIRADKGPWADYPFVGKSSDQLNEARIVVGRGLKGRYLTVKISAQVDFTIHQIDARVAVSQFGRRQ